MSHDDCNKSDDLQVFLPQDQGSFAQYNGSENLRETDLQANDKQVNLQDEDGEMMENNVEDWLAKHLEQAEAERSLVSSQHISVTQEILVVEEDCIHNEAPATAHTLVVVSQTSSSSAEANNADVDLESYGTQTRNGNQYYAENEDIYTAEIATTPVDELVIEGVRAKDPRFWRVLIFVGSIVLASIVAVAAAMIATKVAGSAPQATVSAGTVTNPAANQTLVPISTQYNGTSSLPPEVVDTVAPTSAPTEANLNWTIADKLRSVTGQGPSVATTRAGDIFIKMIARTDTKFTYFGVSMKANLLDAVPLSFISRFYLPLWNGHVVRTSLLKCVYFVLHSSSASVLTNAIFSTLQLDTMYAVTVEGQEVYVDNMYNGMVLMSMAGYPLEVQLDPVRINNVSMSEIQRDWHFKNGAMHIILDYFHPMVPWIGKSSLDVLLQTNQELNGTLSIFISLINSWPFLKNQLQLQKENINATTLFAPTNNALIYDTDANLTAMISNATRSPILNQSNAEIDPTLQQFLLNHIVTGNFAQRCWWDHIPVCVNASFLELKLESQAGQVLSILAINNMMITMNGNVKIIKEDVFSEQGVVHVIDKPLWRTF
jgi:hypothetical protein